MHVKHPVIVTGTFILIILIRIPRYTVIRISVELKFSLFILELYLSAIHLRTRRRMDKYFDI